MRRRQLLALGALVAVAVLAGCFGPAGIDDEELNADAEYDWNGSATVTVTLSRSSYATVVNVTNASTVPVWQRDVIEGDRPVRLSALRFRYPNGTVVSPAGSGLSATVESDRTEIELPNRRGKVAYTAERAGKQFSTPAFIEGSYEVVLPPDSRIGIPLLSQAGPGGWETRIEDGRMVVRWDGIEDGTVSVRYYLQRDIWLFSGLVVLALSIGTGGALYYLRQIRRLESEREEVGLDVDYEDDDFRDDGPPPGMR